MQCASGTMPLSKISNRRLYSGQFPPGACSVCETATDGLGENQSPTRHERRSMDRYRKTPQGLVKSTYAESRKCPRAEFRKNYNLRMRILEVPTKSPSVGGRNMGRVTLSYWRHLAPQVGLVPFLDFLTYWKNVSYWKHAPKDFAYFAGFACFIFS